KRSELDRYIDPPGPAEQPARRVSEPEPAQTAPELGSAAAETAVPEQESAKPAESVKTPEPEQVRDYTQDYNRNPYVRTAQSAADFGTRPQQSADPFGTGRSAGSSKPANGFGGGSVPPRNPNTPPPYRTGGSDTPYYETEETTVISRNTIIDGNIRSFANINIDGSVKGDVKITKNISVTGKVVGDIECNNSVMTGASMQGNIASKGQVQLDRDSILLGDIAAQYLDLNGKIKGNIDVGGKAEFKTDAVVLGNITASTITVLDGATIQGYVNTTFLQESSSSIFPETIAVTE
ncbi:MAG: polymer-forming cytoskeletal protein, partial [Oscillospiraceae bacterium]